VVTGLRDKFEMRKEPCYLIFDWELRKAYYLRADQFNLEFLKAGGHDNLLIHLRNGMFEHDPVKTRDIKSWELQRKLEFEESENAEAADGDPEADDEKPDDAEVV